MKSAKKLAAKPAKTTLTRKSPGFTDEERDAMKEHVKEWQAEARRGKGSSTADGEPDLLAKIAAMPQPDRGMAERLHALVKANAPVLSPRTWYGMPAYAKDGNVVCFFQSSQKFKTRYCTLGFTDKARLDDGRMWPSAFALTDLTESEAAQIAALLKKAVG